MKSLHIPKLTHLRPLIPNLGRNRAQLGASSPLANEQTVCDYDSGSITGQKSDWTSEHSEYESSSILLEVGSHHASMDTSLLRISARWLSCRWGLHRAHEAGTSGMHCVWV